MSDNALEHYLSNPAYNGKRVKVESHEVIEMITMQLISRGIPAGKLDYARWLWVPGEVGPDLILILGTGPKS